MAAFFLSLREPQFTGMIPIMKVTTKGQITLPEKIREWFHLLPGTNVEFLP